MVGVNHTGNDNDVIKTTKGESTLWNFHGAFADQGLLYYWVKFVQKDVSIIHPGYVAHWDTETGNTNADNETVRLRETVKLNEIFKSNWFLYHTFIGCSIFHFDIFVTI
jgi:hypothetical protein